MNHKLTIALLASLMPLLALPPATAQVITSTCGTRASGGPDLSFQVQAGAQDHWDPLTQESPKLPPGKALALARQYIVLKDPGSKNLNWQLDKIELRQMGNNTWYYAVAFDGMPQRQAGAPPPFGIPSPCVIPVRFDGSIPHGERK